MKKIKYQSVILLLMFLLWSAGISSYAAECTEHDFKARVVEHADAKNDGYREYVCRICGYSYTEVIPKTGHIYGEYQIEIEPECLSEGLKYRVCEDCGKVKYEKIPPTGKHIFGEWTVTEQPDCAEHGIRRRVCEQCGQIEEELLISTKEHVYQEMITPPGCETDGEKVYTCQRCGDTYSEIIKATGHQYGELIVKKEAAVDSEGLAVRICEHDEAHILEEAIPRLPVEQTESVRESETLASEAEETVVLEAVQEEKQGLFNELDIVISGMNIISVLFWTILLRRDRYIINWDKAQG